MTSNGQSLALVDSGGAQDCGPAGCCAKLVLPVRWTEAMPEVGQYLQMSGSIQEVDGKLLFVASTIDEAATQPEGSQ